MLAGGMTIAAPSMMPQAAAAGALYVSAENAMFNNTFGGAQVIEVIVIGIADETDEKQGEPVVKVDENQLRMAQGVDGAWYGYFADSTQATAADGESYLDFGTAGATDPLEGDWNEAAGTFKVTSTAAPTTVVTNYPVLSNWNKTDSTQESTNPNGLHYGKGQIGLNPAEWPVIQTYDFTAGDYTFDVVLEQAGADEVVTLTHDSADLDDYASLTIDRSSASVESDIHLVITDNQLNIDPTAEDIVSFYVSTGVEGVSWMNRTINATTDEPAWAATNYAPYSNAFDDNGKLIINNATNGGSSIIANDVTLDDGTADNLMIFYEGGENSGIFYNTDDNDDANIDVADYAKRGFTATFDYNDSAQSFVVANYFGTIDMVESSVGDAWNSGEALTVTLTDEDLNKNTGSDEDLVIANTTRTQLIPALQIGSPLSLSGDSDDLTAAQVSSYSKIAYYTNASIASTVGTEALPYIFDTGYTGADVNAMKDSDNTYFNWHTASFNNGSSAVDDSVKNTSLVNARTGDVIIQASGSSGIEEITGSGLTMAGTLATDDIHLNITKNAAYGSSHSYTAIPVIADIFSFGEGTNNAVYRLLLEETDDNTSVFEGSIEYMMLNQINIDLDGTYTDLATIDQDIDIIIEQDMTDEDSPRVNYLDLGADGISTQIADQLEAPTHDGVVSFDMDNYKIGDTVVVTLDDQDMNEDSELIDVYTTNTNDRVGASGATTLATGLVLDITFDDVAWINHLDDATCTTEPTGSNGLESSGFTLVETGPESGIFTGSFQIPTNFCHETKGTVTVTGTDIEVNYQDFRNASGESTEVGDGASVNANTGSVLLIELYIQYLTLQPPLTYTQL